MTLGSTVNFVLRGFPCLLTDRCRIDSDEMNHAIVPPNVTSDSQCALEYNLQNAVDAANE